MTGWEMISCQRGHEQHDTREIVVSLGGPTKYRDLPSIPRRFADTFEMEIWDTARYPVDDGLWCPAHDAVSETLVSHGIWEPAETTLMLEAFRYVDTFVDIGAQLGWYSVLAARAGLNVVAFEADLDVAAVCNRNMARHAHLLAHFGVHIVRVGPEAGQLVSPSNERIAVKIDIEGAEADAVAMLAGAMDNIDFMLIEISPVFNDTYPDLVAGLIELGFNAYLVPTKQFPPASLQILPDDLAIWDLGSDLEEVRATVGGWHQQNVLFVRDGVW